MGLSRLQWILSISLLVVGTYDTLIAKAVDEETATDSYGNVVYFNHPFFQVCFMFLAECLCLIAFYVLRMRKPGGGAAAASKEVAGIAPESEARPRTSPFLFLPPAMCDMTSTCLMNIGLVLTSASNYAMLRASVIVFTSLLAVLVLKRRLELHHWAGIAFVVVGTIIVGSASLVCTSGGDAGCGATNTSTGGASMESIGNGLIVLAQVFSAVQMVLEEWYLSRYSIEPLEMVGMEGVWGFGLICTIVAIFYFVPKPAFLMSPCTQIDGTSVPTPAVYSAHLENALDGFVMMANQPAIIGMLISYMISLAFYNFIGVSLTRELGATSRRVLDTVRTTTIWAISLALKWEDFCWVQVVGFAFLIAGQGVYVELLRLPASCMAPCYRSNAAEVGSSPAALDDGDGETSSPSRKSTPRSGDSFRLLVKEPSDVELAAGLLA